MENKSLADQLSKLYREVKSIANALERKTFEASKRLDKDRLSYNEYVNLVSEIEFNTNKIKEINTYADGIHDSREILLGSENVNRFKLHKEKEE